MSDSTNPAADSTQEDLYAATEAVRAAEFDSVPADLLAAILHAEQANFENRLGAAREVTRAIDSWLSAHAEPAPDGLGETDLEAMS